MRSTVMRLHQRDVALLVVDDSLLHITLAQKKSCEEYASYFIRDEYRLLMIYLRLMEPH